MKNYKISFVICSFIFCNYSNICFAEGYYVSPKLDFMANVKSNVIEPYSKIKSGVGKSISFGYSLSDYFDVEFRLANITHTSNTLQTKAGAYHIPSDITHNIFTFAKYSTDPLQPFASCCNIDYCLLTKQSLCNDSTLSNTLFTFARHSTPTSLAYCFNHDYLILSQEDICGRNIVTYQERSVKVATRTYNAMLVINFKPFGQIDRFTPYTFIGVGMAVSNSRYVENMKIIQNGQLSLAQTTSGKKQNKSLVLEYGVGIKISIVDDISFNAEFKHFNYGKQYIAPRSSQRITGNAISFGFSVLLHP